MRVEDRGLCCIDCSQQVEQQRAKSAPSTPAGDPAKQPGIVHLFGGVFVGAVAEEMYRTLQVVVQSSGIDLSATTALPPPTAAATAPTASVDDGSSSTLDEPLTPTLPAASRLSRGEPSPSEGEQQGAGGGEGRPAGNGAITGTKRARGGGKSSSSSSADSGCVEGDGCTSFVSECSLPTEKGLFRLRAYRYSGRRKSHEPVVMVCGEVRGRDNVPVRVHDQCQTSEVFGSKRCDCKEQLDQSLRYIQENSGGAVIYLAQEGRGIGLANKVAAYNLQDDGLDTVEANRRLGFKDDERTYECVDFILRDMGIKSIRLMTNNPFKMDWMRARGVKVQARIPIQVAPNEHNHTYLETKAARMSHLINNL